MSVGVAVLGVGRIGRVHCDAIAATSGAELASVFDPDAGAAETMRERHGCAIRDLDEIEAAEDVRAVAICTPTDTHADLIERFCRAGKAVFCEKPVDLDLKRVRDCLKTVDTVGGTLMIGFNRRFDPDFRALKATIDDGRIGEVEMVSITSRDPAPPPISYIRRSGGIFRDMTIHDFDVARWLLGEAVETVTAAASVLVDPEIGRAGDHDSAQTILRTASGRLCSIANSRRASYGYDQRVEVHGSAGAVAAENVHEARVVAAGADGYLRPPLKNFFLERYMPAYEAEIAAFVDVVANGAPVPTTGEDGLMALALAEAAEISVREGRAVAVREML